MPNPMQPQRPGPAPRANHPAFATLQRRTGYAGNPEARNNRPPPEDLDDDLIKQCRAFLAAKIPISNVVFADEFSKYMPLFNKDANADQSHADELKELNKEYFGRFSPQHPIQILSREHDPQGVMHPTVHEKFKLLKTIPPVFRTVSSLNSLGEKIPTLINALFNATTHPSGPFDKRKEQYIHAIAQAVNMADAKAGGRKQQEAEFAEMADKLVHDKPAAGSAPAKPAQEEQSSLSGLSLWG